MDMASHHTSSVRRSRKLRRRISSSAIAWINGSPKSITSSPVRLPSRKASLSPSNRNPTFQNYQRTHLTDGSDYEDYQPVNLNGQQLRGRSTSLTRKFFEERPVPTAYASLPPTPIQPSRPFSPLTPVSPISPISPSFDSVPHQLGPDTAPFSLWDYLREELLATDFDSHQELKWERVSNFLNIPLAMEKIIGFGFVLCFDSFLYTFTILPIRFLLALFPFVTNVFRKSATLPASQKADLLRALLLVTSILILNPLTDASKIYHTIRGQETIKLYVIFNALEIGDRLCASIGQDILDCLFSRSTLEPLSRRVPVSSDTFRPLLFFFLALVYTVSHALVMVYQLISLNVAINSYDHALLTLLVSNQFVEIKGSVFKKFEKDSLFQITCADIVERFTLSLMLFIVAFRNLIELSGSEFDFTGGFVLPKSWVRGNNLLWTISYPVLTVMVSEMLVDWLKHAFITKFNHIRPSVYERYIDVLCRDLASMTGLGRRARKHSYVDQSPLVARRLGFASLPLAVLAILVGSQSIGLMFSAGSDFASPWTWTIRSLSNAEIMHYVTWAVIGLLFWLCSVVVKIIVGVNLLSYATRRRTGMDEREAADKVNDFGRDPIGEGKEEQLYNKKLKTLLDSDRDDVPHTSEMGENRPGEHGGKKKGRIQLEDLTRYTMVKRIW
ncbi:eukaryotic membrane protein family-domain-containing protein [Gymnopilus junonius]|uniref:Eukaryotic membrane protein family-domain-containing protein n=1 Tax=Gymnopilus junonius TaxID=109634 RepID=A0A9P5NRZ7_GYMJU|nr:eukaryotic membrane protein family-domain-containing protein [Gymnopilus junonius]